MGIVKITKIEDDFKGKHPNNINKGAVIGGMMLHPPKVGESFWVNTFATSTVVEIIDENTFRTLNSVYKIEYNGEVKIFNESKKQIPSEKQLEVTDMFNKTFKINIK